MPVREQWPCGCSARDGEPGAMRKDPQTRAPSHCTQTRGAEQVQSVTRATNARIVCGDGLDPKPSWEGKSAGELSERLGTGIPTMQLKDCLGVNWGLWAMSLLLALSHRSFPASAPEITAVPCHSWSWALTPKAEGGMRLQKLLVPQQMEGVEEQVRDEWKAKRTERITVTFIRCLKLCTLSWSVYSVG